MVLRFAMSPGCMNRREGSDFVSMASAILSAGRSRRRPLLERARHRERIELLSRQSRPEEVGDEVGEDEGLIALDGVAGIGDQLVAQLGLSAPQLVDVLVGNDR